MGEEQLSRVWLSWHLTYISSAEEMVLSHRRRGINITTSSRCKQCKHTPSIGVICRMSNVWDSAAALSLTQDENRFFIQVGFCWRVSGWNEIEYGWRGLTSGIFKPRFYFTPLFFLYQVLCNCRLSTLFICDSNVISCLLNPSSDP